MKTRSTIILAAGCIIVLGIFLFGVLTVLNVNSSRKLLSLKIDYLFSKIQDGTFADTYESDGTSELRALVSREDYVQLGNAIRVRLGSLRSKKVLHVNIRFFNGATYADVACAAPFERGNGGIRATFKKELDEWRLVALQVNSPEFQKDVATRTCDNCGQPVPDAANFCPLCGKDLREQ